MKLEITGTARLAILAESDHERQWLRAFTGGFEAPTIAVEYTYPNDSSKTGFNIPCVTLTVEKKEKHDYSHGPDTKVAG